ncbi:MAG: hypothetical protein R2711_09915 [Acidimicrobiales bacterium]
MGPPPRPRGAADFLYGFATKDERDAFEALLAPTASALMAILSVHPPVSLARVLAGDDVAALCPPVPASARRRQPPLIDSRPSSTSRSATTSSWSMAPRQPRRRRAPTCLARSPSSATAPTRSPKPPT